jgi:hypothetical protein
MGLFKEKPVGGGRGKERVGWENMFEVHMKSSE